MSKKTDKIYSSIKIIENATYIFYVLWCIEKAIDIVIVNKNMLPDEKWSNQTIGLAIISCYTVVCFFCSIFTALWRTRNCNYDMNLNMFLRIFLNFIFCIPTLIAIITCAVEWPKTLLVFGFIFTLHVITKIITIKQNPHSGYTGQICPIGQAVGKAQIIGKIRNGKGEDFNKNE